MTVICATSSVNVTEKARESLEEAFEELLTENQGSLSRLVASYATAHERDDLLQEIAIALWRALPKFRGDCSKRTFLFRIAHNRCITHITRRRQCISIEEMETEIRDASADTERAVAQGEQREQLLRAVRQLPAMYREVVVLMLEGFDYREIADVVGISESNVGVRLNRARRQIKILVEEQL